MLQFTESTIRNSNCAPILTNHSSHYPLSRKYPHFIGFVVVLLIPSAVILNTVFLITFFLSRKYPDFFNLPNYHPFISFCRRKCPWSLTTKELLSTILLSQLMKTNLCMFQ